MKQEKVSIEDRMRQKEQFTSWFRRQERWSNISQMAKATDITRDSLRHYMSGKSIARGANRMKLRIITKLTCFAPNPLYNDPSSGRAAAVKAGARKKSKPRRSIKHTESGSDPKLSLILDAVRATQTGVDALSTNLSLLAAAMKDQGAEPGALPEVQAKIQQVVIALPDLPEVDVSNPKLTFVRDCILAITKELAAYSNLPQNSADREKARRALLHPAQELFVVLLIFDKQYPTAFAEEAQRFVDLLGIDARR